MPTFTLTEAKAPHCGQMARRLRHAHADAVTVLGMNSHRELRGCLEQSCYARAWFIDGRLSALGGVIGSLCSADGFIWLALTEEATRYPLAIVKEARRQLAGMMLVKKELATTILPNDAAAKRLAIFLGFHISETGDGRMAVTRAARRNLMRAVETDPDCRIPFGKGHVVAMGYHPGEAA